MHTYPVRMLIFILCQSIEILYMTPLCFLITSLPSPYLFICFSGFGFDYYFIPNYDSCLLLCTFDSLLFGFGLLLVVGLIFCLSFGLRISDYLVTELCSNKLRFLRLPWSASGSFIRRNK